MLPRYAAVLTSNTSKGASVQEGNCSLNRLCTEEKNEVSIKISSSITKGSLTHALVILESKYEICKAKKDSPTTISPPQETVSIPSLAILDDKDETCKTNACPPKTISLPQELMESVNSASSVIGLVDVANIDGQEEGSEASHPILHIGESYGKSKGAKLSKNTTVLSNPTEDSTLRCNSLTTNSLTLTTSPEQQRARTNWLPSRSYKFVSKILSKQKTTERKQQWLYSLREPEIDDRRMEMVFFERLKTK